MSWQDAVITPPTHPVPSARPGRRGLGRVTRPLAVTAAVVTTLALAALPAQAAGDVSRGAAQFLSGSVGGTDLAGLLEVTGAKAANPGSPTVVTSTNPLSASAFQGVDVPLASTGVNLLGGNGILRLGAVQQVARAVNDGSSSAGSGAVAGSGPVTVGSGSGGNADLSLDSLAAAYGLTGLLSKAEVTTGALSATATQTTGGKQTGAYRIGALRLALTGPQLGALTDPVNASDPLADHNGETVAQQLADLNTQLGKSGKVGNLPDLQALVDANTDFLAANSSIEVDIDAGTVDADVAGLLAAQGLDINDLPPGTDLVPSVTKALNDDVLPGLVASLKKLQSDTTAAFDAITVNGAAPNADDTTAIDQLRDQIANGLASSIGNADGQGTGALTNAVSHFLSLTANVQQSAAGTFTETALQFSLARPELGLRRPGVLAPRPAAALAGATAIVNLASAAVGANAGPIVPTLTGITPVHGPEAGGTQVTLTGSGFVAGGTSVTIGGVTVPAAQVTVDPSGNSLTFTTPAHAPGAVSVTTTTAGGTSPAQQYTYDPTPVTSSTPTSSAPSTTVSPTPTTASTAPATTAASAPTATGLSPGHGPEAGGTTVTITGTGFLPGGTSVTIGGVTIPAGSVTVGAGGTSLTFVTPQHSSGPVAVTTTTSGRTTAARTFTYDPAPPVITGPGDGSSLPSGLPVTISGTGDPGDTVTVTSGDTVVCVAVVDAAGTWSCTPVGFGPGSVTLTATQTDSSGDVSGPSAAVTFSLAGPELANTGAEPGPGLALGALLLLLGLSVVVLGRRRSSRR